jgi:hypothetical protein
VVSQLQGLTEPRILKAVGIAFAAGVIVTLVLVWGAQLNPFSSTDSNTVTYCPSPPSKARSHVSPVPQICVQTPGTSFAEGLITSLLAAGVGAGVALLTYVLGRRADSEKERRREQTVVSVVLSELQSNQKALNDALLELPEGGAHPEYLSVAIFNPLRTDLAESLQSTLLSRSFQLYELFAPLVGRDLRGVGDNARLERLLEQTQNLVRDLAPYGLHIG